ncbi:Ankyrin repeat protein 1 [Giardia muris]|uniref:Ankyrin repeat protein 1 n=1 Tax=Giardia muris TaxID=5742 RepID=A0A4Z1SUA4_GIAMU|nr:Ankyrin repeat protein 1 [Giardia muris]|eukprot:TNJ29482.1 Ankyrin repeat protein 1 [Giardia muris]
MDDERNTPSVQLRELAVGAGNLSAIKKLLKRKEGQDQLNVVTDGSSALACACDRGEWKYIKHLIFEAGNPQVAPSALIRAIQRGATNSQAQPLYLFEANILHDGRLPIEYALECNKALVPGLAAYTILDSFGVASRILSLISQQHDERLVHTAVTFALTQPCCYSWLERIDELEFLTAQTRDFVREHIPHNQQLSPPPREKMLTAPQKGKGGLTPLHKAVLQNNLLEIKKNLKHLGVVDSKGNTALMYAVWAKHLYCVPHLLTEAGLHNEAGESPLTWAIILRVDKIVGMLTACKNNCIPHTEGEDPLSVAAREGYIKGTEILLGVYHQERDGAIMSDAIHDASRMKPASAVGTCHDKCIDLIQAKMNAK